MIPSVEGEQLKSAVSTPLIHLKDIVFMPLTISSTSVFDICQENVEEDIKCNLRLAGK